MTWTARGLGVLGLMAPLLGVAAAPGTPGHFVLPSGAAPVALANQTWRRSALGTAPVSAPWLVAAPASVFTPPAPQASEPVAAATAKKTTKAA
ncbi:MAG: hypothetical protein CFE45_40160, partial [Burkholderiales bacterium PBB5]